MRSPVVSVIMPLYNGEKYLRESINSILNQSYENFELIIVNDGSKDKSEELIQKISDNRITLLSNEANRGLAFSLNKGINNALGKYILRMDADDLALPNRIKRQVEFMEKNLEIGASGTWMKSFGESNYLKKYPITPELCKIQLLFDVPIGHPSAIIRKDVIIKHNLYYNEELQTYGEDYDLWFRLSKKSKIANLPEVLMMYRTYRPSQKQLVQDKRIKQANIIRETFLKEWDLDNGIDMGSHKILSVPQLSNKFDVCLIEIEKWAKLLVQHNKKKGTYDDDSFFEVVAEKFFEVCYHNPSISTVNLFQRSPFNQAIGLQLIIKFWIKSILGSIKLVS